MKSFYSIILVLALSNALLAQQGKISGTVIDHQTGEPLVGVKVKHISSGREVLTDFDGNFSFSTAFEGINKISLEYVSYQEVVLHRVKVAEKQQTELKIKMQKVGGSPTGGNYMAVRPDNDPRS